VLTRLRNRRGRGRRYHFIPIVLVLAVTGVLAAAGSGLEDGEATGDGSAPARSARKAPQGGSTLRIAFAERPRSLDPALATDRTAQNVVLALGDPLVRLGPALQPSPGLAGRWTVSDDGLRVTFQLRNDGRWTTGERVTASDFVYAWLRVLDPETSSPHAPLFFGIRGAKAYNECVAATCGRLRRAVGVEARDERTLVVALVAPRPWFPAEAAHPAFLPLHRSTVEWWGRRWTRPERIVTSGPFTLASLGRSSFSLARSARWRDANQVGLARVEGRVIPSATGRTQAFDAGRVQALDGTGLPTADLPALRERREYATYPALAPQVYAFNLAAVPDPHQRRAMALAVDRRGLAENVLGREVEPATGFTPGSAFDLPEAATASPWLRPERDLDAARAELERGSNIVSRLTLLHIDEPGNRDVALALAADWRDLGIETEVRSRSRRGYLDFPGPLAADSVDLFQLEDGFRFPDLGAGLSVWACRSARNKTSFCRSELDGLLRRAAASRSRAERLGLYGEAEEILSGEDGAMPGIPLYSDVFANLESLAVAETFAIDPLGRIDFAAVDLP